MEFIGVAAAGKAREGRDVHVHAGDEDAVRDAIEHPLARGGGDKVGVERPAQMPAGPLPMAVGSKRLTVGRPPPYHTRQAVLADIPARLSSHQGGAGVGKLIAGAGYIAMCTSSWGWVDLRELSATALMDMPDRMVTEPVAEDGLTHRVLDDLELPPEPDRAVGSDQGHSRRRAHRPLRGLGRR